MKSEMRSEKKIDSSAGRLWDFIDYETGTFLAPDAEYTSRLYFPLFNVQGMKCFVTPELKGDIASEFQYYLTPATVSEELHRNLSGRNFWIRMQDKNPWSVAGNSAFQKINKWNSLADSSEVEARPGCFTLRRNSKDLGLNAESKLFVPANGDMVELMIVRITNNSVNQVHFTPYFANPIFGRHPDHFRDHRQVTTMFQETYIDEFGVRVKPKMVHNEAGHSENSMQYFIYGFEENGNSPVDFYPVMQDFIGEGGSMDNPEVVFKGLLARNYLPDEIHGKEAIGAFRFDEVSLKPSETRTWIIMHGISGLESEPQMWAKKYKNIDAVEDSLEKTLRFWSNYTQSLAIKSGNKELNGLVPWLNFQLKCRQVYGNSYLPDFGYGRGGRGWRDLWQDLLSIFILDPNGAKEEMLNNFQGVRIDGSNATIIGTRPGEFLADRNNIPRTWSDHGAWPAYVLHFYLNQTGNLDLLMKELPYWKDQHVSRSKKIDADFKPEQGNFLLTHSHEVYQGSLFEHILVQQLTAFFNVGEHNNILLEGGDWNDTYDMAREKGESVCFHSFYAANLMQLAEILVAVQKLLGVEEVYLLREILVLLDRIPGNIPIDYQQAELKKSHLAAYFKTVEHSVSGEKLPVSISRLIHDLKEKSNSMKNHLRVQEWIQLKGEKGFFNGHYNNLGRKQHGEFPDGISMDLTSQVIPILSQVATDKQISQIMPALNTFLSDKYFEGYRLCTPYNKIDLTMGRVSGFVYGYKEHGSKWSQQNIMLMLALYQRGFVQEAYRLLKSILSLSLNSSKSKIFPGIPSYYEPGDRGAYAYLTGSSTWFLLALTSEIFGLKAAWGDLLLHPKLHADFFDVNKNCSITRTFRDLSLEIRYHNPGNLSYPEYKIDKIRIEGKEYSYTGRHAEVLIPYEEIKEIAAGNSALIELILV